MKTVLILTAFCVLILAGCSSNEGTDGDDGSKASTASEEGDIASGLEIPVCDWFAKLIEDINAGLVLGTATAGPAAVGETLYRINNMFGMSVDAPEPIHSAVKNLMSKTRAKFEFEDLREQIDALRDACAQFGLPVPELQ